MGMIERNGAANGACAALEGAVESCLRLIAIAEGLAPTQFAERLHGRHSIGEHLRHCLDHLTAVRRGWEEGFFDYDARDRDPAHETDRDAWLAAMKDAAAWLRERPARDTGRVARIRTAAATGREPGVFESTIERELVFISSHNIHHAALAAVIADGLGRPVARELALAYSTAAHLARGQTESVGQEAERA